MQIINLTPHTITITEGPFEGTHPSAGLARVDGLPDGPIVGLPDPADGVRYIVSVIVAEAVLVRRSTRDDIGVPGEQVRDEAGRIIGCREIVHPRMASPAAWELYRRQRDDELLAKVNATIAAARGGTAEAAATAGHDAAELLGRLTVYRDAHIAAYKAGRAEGLAFAVDRAIYDGRDQLAKALAAALTDPLCGPPGFVHDVLVPEPEHRARVEWIEDGCRRVGCLCRAGHRRWLTLEDCELRPLYVTPDEAEDIIAGARGGDWDLLWNASRRDERIASRKAAKIEDLRRKAAEMLGEADNL